MTASWARGRAIASPLHWLAAILFLIPLVVPAAAAEPIDVALDQATVLQLPDRAKTVVVGNPLIADLSVQPGGSPWSPARATVPPTSLRSTATAPG